MAMDREGVHTTSGQADRLTNQAGTLPEQAKQAEQAELLTLLYCVMCYFGNKVSRYPGGFSPVISAVKARTFAVPAGSAAASPLLSAASTSCR